MTDQLEKIIAFVAVTVSIANLVFAVCAYCRW